jgi:ABC-type Fe3+ transport system permease subunit/DNA-binding beta-propeller fold protein YncE
MSWTLLQNSLLLGLLATGLATGLGLSVALAATGLRPRGRSLLMVASGMVLVLPPFLVTNCWMALLGHAGVLRPWLPLPLYSFGGAVLLLSLMLWPVVALVALAAWKRVDASLLDAEPALRGAGLFGKLLLPAARPVLAPACALTFVLALNHFTVPVLLQVRVLPAEVWLRFNTNLDATGSFLASLPLILAPILMLLWLWRREVNWPRTEGSACGTLLRRQLGGCWRIALAVTAITLGLALLLPLGHLLVDPQTWGSIGAALATGKAAAGASLQNALAAATLVLVAGVLSRHLRSARITWLTLLTPGILIGLALLLTLNRPPFLGFTRGPGIVVLALTLRYLALGWAGARLAGQACDPDLVDAARLEGASRWQVWWHARWPQMAPQLLAAWYVVFLLCLWDIETIVLLAPPGGETLPMVIFNLLHYGHNAQVNALCLGLLLLAGLPALIWLGGRGLSTLRRRHGKLGTTKDTNHTKTGGVASADAPSKVTRTDTRGMHDSRGRQSAPESSRNRRESTAIGSAVTGHNSAGSAGRFAPTVRRRLRLKPTLNASLPRLRFRVFIGFRGFIRWRAWQPTSAALPAILGVTLTTGCTEAPSGTPSVELDSRFFSHVEIVGTRGRGPGEFNKPRSLAVDAADNLFVVDLTGRVQKFDPQGNFLLDWQMPETELGRPKGMGFDADGNLILVEPHYARINHFSPEGKLVRQWGTRGIADGEINFPRAVAVNAAGEIWVSEYAKAERVQRFSPDGSDWLFTLGRAGDGPGEFNRAEGLCVDAQDRLYVADSCNHRIQVFSPEGGFIREYGSPGQDPGQLSYPYDIRVDDDGNQFVCEFGNSRIQVFDAGGQSIEIIGGPGDAPGQFSNPWSMALDSAGNLYVADAANHRVQKLIRRPETHVRHARETAVTPPILTAQAARR